MHTMNALVFALLWLGFFERVLFIASGSVMDRQRRNTDDKDLRCEAVRVFLREKGIIEKDRSNVEQGQPPGESSLCSIFVLSG